MVAIYKPENHKQMSRRIAVRYVWKSVLPAVLAGAVLISGCSSRESAHNQAAAGGENGSAAAPQQSARVEVQWDLPIMTVKSTPTLQVVVNPMLQRGSKIHDGTFEALKDMQANYVRYVPWLPYPKLGVAELKPPTKTATSWNFKLIDPMMKDFMSATAGHSVIINFSTIPQWMFQSAQPVSYPSNPDQVDWNYEHGTKLRDPSMKELGDYYARLVSWYTRGGFTDERGVFHKSGYHYAIPYWEVLNEVDAEHSMTPQQYTKRYDAIAGAILKVDPKMKFVGLALSSPSDPKWFEYFLNHAHHRAGIPLDFISYHFYAGPTPGQTINDWQYTFFDQADGFLGKVKFIQAIRERLSPKTKTDTDELGVILPNDNQVGETAAQIRNRIPTKYWNLAGAMYAYLYIGLAKEGVDVIGESQLVGYPTQFPSVSMIDWNTGKPNARYWVLKLIKDNFSAGDKMVKTSSQSSAIAVQAFESNHWKKLLIINKRNRVVKVELPSDAVGGQVETVDPSTGEGSWSTKTLQGASLAMRPFAVSVVIEK